MTVLYKDHVQITTPVTAERSKPVVSPRTCFVVLVTLLCFSGQILLQGLARTDEPPCATLGRLTGLVIPGMSMMAHSATEMPEMAMPMAKNPHPAPWHGEKTCPLCPLLALSAVILTSLPLLPACTIERYRLLRDVQMPRAPPGPRLGLPPSRGPPLPS